MKLRRTHCAALVLSFASLGGCGRSDYDPPDARSSRADARSGDASTPSDDAFSADDAALDAALSDAAIDAALTPNGMLVPACGIAGGTALVLTISDHIPPATCTADAMFPVNTIRIEGGVSGPGSFVSTDASVVGEASLCDPTLGCVTSNNWQLNFATFDASGATGSYRVELPGMAINGTFFVNRCMLTPPRCR